MRIDRVKFAATLAEKDMKIIELADLTGISRNTLSAIKSGKSCSKRTAKKLAAILGDGIFDGKASVDC